MMKTTAGLRVVGCVAGMLVMVHGALAGDPAGGGPARTTPLVVGVDANYSLDMETAGTTWRWDGEATDLFKGLARQGVQDFRVRLWTKDDGPHGKNYATKVVKRALDAGLNPYLVIFLSEDWSDMMKQPLPEAWKNLSFDERAAAVQAYSKDIVTHFRQEGLRNHLYEIGNEIDYGICGEYPGKSTKKNAASLSQRLWPRSAQLIRASQAGVLAADPEAKFLLHIAHWWDADFCVAFFRHMLDQGVRVDYAGLSYFPSSNIGGSLEMEQFGATATRVAQAIGRPVIVPETAYPSTRDFKGQFSRWKYDVLGYPLSPEGQQRWLADFLAYCHRHPDIYGVYYWSPEWCGEGMWKAFALFDPKGDAKPAWASFSPSSWTNRALLDPVYLEVSSNRFYEVPVQEAKARMVPLIRQLREKTGGVTVEHIALLTNTALNVGSYAVNLKASLQQNLSVTRIPGSPGLSLENAEGPDSLAAWAERLDATRDRVILVVREDSPATVTQALDLFARRNIQATQHPLYTDTPLRFGMCGAFAAAD